jgi:zinc transporter ZupT
MAWKSGFSLKEAAKAQVLTASGGLVGVVAGLTAEHLSSASNWLLPFTAGGFLYIALVSIVPELLDCDSLRNSLVQLGFLGLGVLVMALMTIVEKKSCNYMPPHLVTAEL